MSKICELTGKRVIFGNNVSKALNRTKRRFDANIIKKRFVVYSNSLGAKPRF